MKCGQCSVEMTLSVLALGSRLCMFDLARLPGKGGEGGSPHDYLLGPSVLFGTE